MKTHQTSTHLRLRPEGGSVLTFTLLTTAIIGMVAASYLSLVSATNTSTVRSMAWNQTIPVLEAGIEEALAHINRNSDLTADGWSTYGSLYTKKLAMDEHTSCETWIRLSASPAIAAYGSVRLPLQTSSYVTRRVRVDLRKDALFAKGLVAKGQIDMNGNNVLVDSFDSSDPAYSNGGRYDSSKRKSNGDVATNSQLVNSLNVGNADIYGDVSTGPGGSVQVGSQGFVTGTISDDMNVAFPDVSAPFTSASAPYSGTVNGTSYTYVISSGNWQINGNLSLSGNNKVLVTGTAVLYVTGNVSLSGNSYIEIANSGSLSLYVAGASAAIGGNGVINQNTSAEKFMYYGLPSNTSVSFSGNASFTGVIYAPSAALSLGGGGSNTYDFVGASISSTVTMNGHFNFHYDESLANIGPSRGYVVTSWTEF